MTSSDRFDLLVEKYLAGALSLDERRELRDLLAADPSAREHLTLILRDEAILRGMKAPRFPDHVGSDHRPGASPQARPTVGTRSHHPQRRVWTATTVAAVLLLMLGGVVAWQLERGHERLGSAQRDREGIAVLPTIVRSIGTRIRTVGGTDHPASADDHLEPGDALITAADGNCVLCYPDDTTRFEIAASTELIALDPSQGKRVALRQGRMTARVAPQPVGHPLVVTTPQASVRVIGTQFALTVSKDATHLTVSEGTVRCESTSGQVLDVPAGSGATASANGVEAMVLPIQAPPIAAPVPAGMASAVVLGDWQPLTPSTSLGEWVAFSGTWSSEQGTVTGITNGPAGHARLDSKGPMPAMELSCSIRGVRCAYAEFGVHDYAGYLPLHLGTAAAWHTLHVRIQGTSVSAEFDGVPVTYEGGHLANGTVGFYASSTEVDARIEIRGGKMRK